MTKKEEYAFSLKIIHTQTKTMFVGSNLHMMMQALEEGDGSCLPCWLNKWVAVVVRNLTNTLITITKGFKIIWVIVVNVLPHVGVSPRMLEKLNKMQGIQRAKMSAK